MVAQIFSIPLERDIVYSYLLSLGWRCAAAEASNRYLQLALLQRSDNQCKVLSIAKYIHFDYTFVDYGNKHSVSI